MLVLHPLQGGSIAAVGQRAPGIEVGHDDHLVGAEYLGSLTHEIDTAHHYHVGVGACCPLGQREAVAHIVGHVLYVAVLIVMCHDDSVSALFESGYRSLDVGYADRVIDIAMLFPTLFCHKSLCF